MNARTGWLAIAPLWIALIGGVVAGSEPVKSGLQPGQAITTIFEPINVTGEHAGEPYCLICENGLSPVAMVFARELSEPLMALVAQLDNATVQHRGQEMGSFVVFLSDDEKLRENLAGAAKKMKLKKTVLSTFALPGPEGFSIASDADVTVVLYREHEVKANHAFRRGELTKGASAKIMADLPKILTK